ncbi:MAG: BCCT family transporter [Lachnospiraceae bacterium]|nr:BCCT family transporter [Lachnospiraceae bacterium]
MKEKKKLNKAEFWPPAILCLLIIIIGVAIPQTLEKMVNAGLNWVTTNFNWFYALCSTALIFFCLWAGLGKYGKIRIGGKDAKAEMSFFKWFCIVLTSGMAAGLCYWCIAEPLSFFQNPPVFAGYEGGSPQALESTLRYVYLHWTLHPYAAYTSVGVCIGFMYWNCRKPFSISSSLYPLIGEKATGGLRHWINALCIFCLVAGLGTTLGLAIDQLTEGIKYITGLTIDRNILALIVCLGFAGIAIAAASTGLHKGIAMISTLNMYLFIFLLVFALFFGGTLFCLNNTITGLGQFIDIFFKQALYTEPGYESGWVNGWTIFYWGWWIAFAPMIGLFQVKLSKGRTIREYVIVNMLAPCIFLVMWMGTFGSSAMHMEFTGNHAISEAIAQYSNSIAFFAYLKQLPLAPLLLVLAVIAVVFSIVTQTEAEVLTIADMCVASDEELAASDNFAPVWLKVFWGLVMSLLAFTLLYSGGLNAVQTISIILGLPMLILLVVMCISTIKGLTKYKEYDQTLKDGEDY